jgi:hypothetical protein
MISRISLSFTKRIICHQTEGVFQPQKRHGRAALAAAAAPPLSPLAVHPFGGGSFNRKWASQFEFVCVLPTSSQRHPQVPNIVDRILSNTAEFWL